MRIKTTFVWSKAIHKSTLTVDLVTIKFFVRQLIVLIERSNSIALGAGLQKNKLWVFPRPELRRKASSIKIHIYFSENFNGYACF
jgi:hypothetical protein